LRALADVGYDWAAWFLVWSGDLDGLRGQADAGDRNAPCR
jgi:hypothetical protein